MCFICEKYELLKILHTADWHIGKQLYRHSLDEELSFFFGWMIDYIKNENVDILLVSGDIFDLANPSHHSRKMYYDVLKSLIGLSVKVVITGGNHDSITNLEASSELLALLDIKVVGGVPEKPEEYIFKYDIDDEEIIVVALPYIRDKDIRKGDGVIADSDRIKAIQDGIVALYQKAKEDVLIMYGEKEPTIAMGHLYLQSAKTSESEREIQIGNLAGVESTELSKLFDYVALGHIHRPQSFADGRIRYSGSPVSLSFSERKDEKQIVIIEVKEGECSTQIVHLPRFRELIKISGSLQEVKEGLRTVKNDKPLVPYIEIEVKETNYSIPLIEETRNFIASQSSDQFIIVKDRISFDKSPRSLAETAPSLEIGDIKPIDVFNKKIAEEGVLGGQREELKLCFYELLEQAYADEDTV